MIFIMSGGKQACAILCLLCLLCRVISDVSIRKLGERIVRIRAGLIRGVQVDFPNNKNLKSVERFSGLQYASVRGIRGNGLRFMPPSSILPRWGSSPLEHTQFSPVCPQDRRLFTKTYPDGVAEKLGKIAEMAKTQDENCLFLNIWAQKPGKCSIFRCIILGIFDTKILCNNNNNNNKNNNNNHTYIAPNKRNFPIIFVPLSPKKKKKNMLWVLIRSTSSGRF